MILEIIKNILLKLVDIFYPPRCPVCDEIVVPKGDFVCDKCRNAFTRVGNIYCIVCGKPLKNESSVLCTRCNGKNHTFDECRAAFIYDDVMRKSIYRFKYHRRCEYSKYYGREIVSIFKDKINQYNADAIIAVPMYRKKQRQRGYNQAYLIAKEISHQTKIPILNNYIVRGRSTAVMRNLGAEERENNLKKAFKISSDVVKLTNVIIVDDIYTTGATMDAVASCLKASGVKRVYGICLCAGRTGD